MNQKLPVSGSFFVPIGGDDGNQFVLSDELRLALGLPSVANLARLRAELRSSGNLPLGAIPGLLKIWIKQRPPLFAEAFFFIQWWR